MKLSNGVIIAIIAMVTVAKRTKRGYFPFGSNDGREVLLANGGCGQLVGTMLRSSLSRAQDAM